MKNIINFFKTITILQTLLLLVILFLGILMIIFGLVSNFLSLVLWFAVGYVGGLYFSKKMFY